ncbi:MAG: hypothetical protein COA99_02045 [Moraxellaceae bacterium]|nr:MAG: hypothetical protein COA99_02045 [Moraxellaceae bacterium]
MYESYFGLKEAPFSIAPNPNYLYMSRQHNEALAHLIYGVEREGGFILLTGEVGTGKTTICRCFLEQVPENADVAFILNPKLDSKQLLESICDELSINYVGDSLTIKDYTDHINERLLRSHSKGRHTVLVIDEAQNLSPIVLEQLRLLTNLETNEKKLLQIILLGQPELQDIFLKPELRQLNQRVTARFHLDALSKEEISPYVYHRLAVSGCAIPEVVFPEKSIQKLYSLSKGIPRVINLICDRSLLGAYAENKKIVDTRLLQIAAREILGKGLVLHKDSKPLEFLKAEASRHWVAVLGLCVACLALGVVIANTISGSSTVQAPSEEIVANEPFNAIGKVSRPEASADSPPASLQSSMGKWTVKNIPEPTSVGISASSYLGVDDQFTLNDIILQAGELSKELSYVSLLKLWGIYYSPETSGFACRYAKKNGINCLSKIGSIGLISHLGLPAILTLFDDVGNKHHLVLQEISNNSVHFIVGGRQFAMSVVELHRFWRGHFTVLWKRPPQYISPLQPGSISPVNRWLGKQLDTYEGVDQPSLGRSYYDDALASRVKSFQQDVGEQADGIAGVNTLILLSKYTDKNIPSLKLERGRM